MGGFDRKADKNIFLANFFRHFRKMKRKQGGKNLIMNDFFLPIFPLGDLKRRIRTTKSMVLIRLCHPYHPKIGG